MGTEYNPLSEVVADYSDKQLREVLNNPRRFSPKLVAAAQILATERSLDLTENQEANPFLTAASEYTDAKILEVVSNPNRFAGKLVEACKQEATARGLASTGTNESTFTESQALYEARQMLGRDAQISKITERLVSKGIQREDALKIIDKAVRMPALVTPSKKQADDSGPSVWTILFIIFIVVRIILRIARN